MSHTNTMRRFQGQGIQYDKLTEPSAHSQELNSKTDEQLDCFGYKYSRCKSFVFHFFSLLLGGIPYLVVYWHKEWSAFAKCVKCSLYEADCVVMKDIHGQYSVEEISLSPVDGRFPQEYVYSPLESERLNIIEYRKTIRYFIHHNIKYVWDNSCQCFKRLSSYDCNTKLSHFLDMAEGLSPEDQLIMSKLHGKNSIDVEVKSYGKLFVEEVFHPFYIFQIGSVILWSLDEYYYYAGCVFFLSGISIGVSLYETRKQSLALRNMVTSSSANVVHVCRKNGVIEEVDTSCLVPGDVISVPPQGCMMTCDAILIAGNCIVNESMLTGESVPVTKTPAPHSDEIYSPELHKRHTLFCGTQVIQTRYYGNNKVLAVVIRTGFATAKGELIRSILFPKPMGFKFYKDSVKFIILLFFIASFGMAYCVYIYVSRGADIETILLRTLDIITIVVPPALPAAMTVGTVYAQNRLQKKGIFCISPPRINVCGKLKLICFDKTGTLTEEGLDLWGVIERKEEIFDRPVTDVTTLSPRSPIVAAMATCHSLTRIQGALTGDPLDLKMFEATRWELDEPGQDDTSRYDLLVPATVRPSQKLSQQELELQERRENSHAAGDSASNKTFGETHSEFEVEQVPYEIGIMRQFPFSSSMQCMSVITRILGKRHMDVYCKGAPEKIQSLCKSDTVPKNFSDFLTEYASSGFRVIALAHKRLDHRVSWHQVQRVKRDQIEKDLSLLGMLVMQNTLKPETTPVIQKLHMAQIRPVMVTGDNILTAISVARDCGMVLPLDRVIQVKGFNSDENQPARIEFGLIESSQPLNSAVNEVTRITVTLDQSQSNFHFAVDGKTWTVLRNSFPRLIPAIVTKGTVFARMGPEQKTQLVDSLQNLDYIVGMCGDGANDCGALKAAHIGISLSETEASVAAPFTSKVPNITCVPSVIQEGRCSLVTSFGVFKYMALYSLVQFITVLILYTRETNLGNMQFLYIDLVITTSLAVVMGRTEPSDRIVPQRPVGSLVSVVVVVPILLQIVITAAIQLGAFYFLTIQSWYEPIDPDVDEEIVICWENTVIFCISSYQYLILAGVFSKGKPYRKPFYTNILFLLTLISLIACTTLIMVFPIQPMASFFEVMSYSRNWQEVSFRLSLLALPVTNLCLSLFVEMVIADSLCLKKCSHCITRKNKPKNKFKIIRKQVENNTSWLRIGEALYSDAIL